MTRGAQLLVLALVGAFVSPAWGQPAQRPTQQQVESFLVGAVPALRSCLQRSLPAPPRPHVVVTLEFDPAGGFPMPMEIEAAPGSAVERCVGEALAELNAPAIPGPPLVVQCRLPLAVGPVVQCRVPPVVAPAAPPPAPLAPPPPAVGPPPAPRPAGAPPAAPPPGQLGPALSRAEVADAMRGLAPRVQQCVAAAAPPATVRLTIEIGGNGVVTLLDTLPSPPPSVSACLSLAVSSVRLRVTNRDPMTVSYPFAMSR
jgi:hypothetical protein